MKILISIVLLTVLMSPLTQANNGDFILPDHPWSEPARAVVPLYQGVIPFDKEKGLLADSQEPQASCTGTLINQGHHVISAAHCFRDLCDSRKLKKKYHSKQDFFTLIDGSKVFFSDIYLHPSYCALAYDLPYEEKIAPNSLFPEVAYDIAIAKVDPDSVQTIQEHVGQFPAVRLESHGTETSERLTKIGYGVSSRFALYQTLWSDQDKDNVHDYWDLCPGTKEILIPKKYRITPEFMLQATGCSPDQTPQTPARVLDYYTSNKISHKRGYQFHHFLDNALIFDSLRLDASLFLVHHGFYGSLKPYKGYAPMSFGGDSGGPSFNEDLSEIVAITILLNNTQDFVMDHVKNKKLSREERRDLLHSGFNVLLKISNHKDFINEAIRR